MPAPKAKRPASAKAAVRKPAMAQRAQRPGAPRRKPPAFGGALYPFIGFRFMCRQRHARH